MMQGIAWKRGCHEISKKTYVEISLGGTGNHGDGVTVFVASLMLLVFCDLLSLICDFVYFWCKALPLCCGVMLLLIFMGFLLVCFLFFPFMF